MMRDYAEKSEKDARRTQEGRATYKNPRRTRNAEEPEQDAQRRRTQKDARFAGQGSKQFDKGKVKNK